MRTLHCRSAFDRHILEQRIQDSGHSGRGAAGDQFVAPFSQQDSIARRVALNPVREQVRDERARIENVACP